jgi:hypothetical protein
LLELKVNKVLKDHLELKEKRVPLDFKELLEFRAQ